MRIVRFGGMAADPDAVRMRLGPSRRTPCGRDEFVDVDRSISDVHHRSGCSARPAHPDCSHTRRAGRTRPGNRRRHRAREEPGPRCRSWSLAVPIDEKVGWVREGAGDRFDDLELNAWLAAAELTEDPTVPELFAEMFGTDVESFRGSPLALVGSESDCAEQLHARRERWGYSYHVIPGDRAHDFAPLVQRLTGT